MPDRDPPAVLTTLEACALLGVNRHTLRDWEVRGILTRLGKVNVGHAVAVTYARSDLLSARERAVKPPRLKRKSDPPAPFAVPEGMMTAAEVAEMLGVTGHTVNDMQRAGRLMPAEWAEVPQGGSPMRLYRADDVVAFATARDGASPQVRIAAILAALREGMSLSAALADTGTSRTTWHYWARTRSDAAAIHAQSSTPSRVRTPSSIGFVYFVTGTGPRDAVKIGWTCDPPSRLAKLQTSSPVELRYLALVRAHSPFEFWCHRQFEPDRKYGEWFARTPRLSRFVSRMAEIEDVTTLTPGELLALLNVEPLSLFGGNHGPTP